jgi:GH15 family glucan-1,4-alpha-glucosidase
VLERGTANGHLIKHIDGDDAVEATLLWACTPFGEHAMLSPLDPIMLATTERIASDLMEAGGGLHRYRADTFYGGGEWTLLTALFGQYCIQAGDRTDALRCLRVVEAHADPHYLLPEQWSTAVLAPAFVPQWIER